MRSESHIQTSDDRVKVTQEIANNDQECLLTPKDNLHSMGSFVSIQQYARKTTKLVKPKEQELLKC